MSLEDADGSADCSDDGRSLGTGGNVLVNGRRVAGKENSPRDQLDRISASNVERIETIRDTSGYLNVRGASHVINIVLKRCARRRAGTFRAGDDLSNPLSAVGNIGRAERRGMTINASTRLGYGHLPDAIAALRVDLFDSSATDPFLGTEQRIDGRGQAVAGTAGVSMVRRWSVCLG